MNHSTATPACFASPRDERTAELAGRVQLQVRSMIDVATTFLRKAPTPATTHQFENDLAERLQGLGRAVVVWTFNHVEADDSQAMPHVHWQQVVYRRKRKSHNRSLNCRFGPIDLRRYRYEPVDTNEPSIIPLEIALGIEAERATPALAERVGHAAAAHTQGGVRALLAHYHGVHWSVKVLRKVTACLSEGLTEHREAAQAARLVEALRPASASVGPHRPTVCVGRDGVMVPLRGPQSYAEAATGTVSILDRRGRRIYTAYLGRMPEPEQQTLSRQMTSLLLAVMALWTGLMPRWQYVTDGGQSPTAYFRTLRRLRHPRTQTRLPWEWVIDFFHASGYLTKL